MVAPLTLPVNLSIGNVSPEIHSARTAGRDGTSDLRQGSRVVEDDGITLRTHAEARKKVRQVDVSGLLRQPCIRVVQHGRAGRAVTDGQHLLDVPKDVV